MSPAPLSNAGVGFGKPNPPTYFVPDIVNNWDFSGGTGPLYSWAGSPNPPTAGGGRTIGLDNTHLLLATTQSLLSTLPPNPGPGDFSCQCRATISPQLDRTWMRVYFYIDAAFDGICKFSIYEASSSDQFGGVYLHGPGAGVAGSLSIFLNDNPANNAACRNLAGMTGAASPGTGGWHSFELDYWRNGDPSGWPSMAYWIDNLPFYLPAATQGAPCYWDGNGRYQCGVRLYSTQIATIGLGELENGNPACTTSTNVWFQFLAISSLGRIGPAPGMSF